MKNRMIGIIAACIALVTREPLAVAQMLPTALELVIAIDVSASVDRREFELQAKGISEAFAHPEVIAAIESLGEAGMAVALVQWSSPEHAIAALPFTHVYDRRTSRAFGFLVGLTQRRDTAGTTAMAHAVEFSAELIDRNDFAGERLVIDVSGDGRNNSPPDMEAVRDHVVKRGFTINGLAILSDDPALDSYYRGSLIGGQDAFMEVAATFDEFAGAMRRKLTQEIYPPLSQSHERRFAGWDEGSRYLPIPR